MLLTFVSSTTASPHRISTTNDAPFFTNGISTTSTLATKALELIGHAITTNSSIKVSRNGLPTSMKSNGPSKTNRNSTKGPLNEMTHQVHGINLAKNQTMTVGMEARLISTQKMIGVPEPSLPTNGMTWTTLLPSTQPLSPRSKNPSAQNFFQTIFEKDDATMESDGITPQPNAFNALSKSFKRKNVSRINKKQSIRSLNL